MLVQPLLRSVLVRQRPRQLNTLTFCKLQEPKEHNPNNRKNLLRTLLKRKNARSSMPHGASNLLTKDLRPDTFKMWNASPKRRHRKLHV